MSNSTGCYNTNCPGFNLAPDAKLAPGSVLPISTTQQKHTLTIKIAKEKDAWSLYAGVDGSATYIGNWPDSLFIGLADKATDINFGGFTQSPNKILSPPMGSGYLSESIGAATFKDVQFIDNQGNAYGIDWKLPSDVTVPTCYDIGDLENRQFAYGGPGGCTN
ncbi:hypothetical protein LUZ60_001092 [Juncus effusus]|nr:hypothetical protein LUZ60_001092 [Juncus effusus]